MISVEERSTCIEWMERHADRMDDALPVSEVFGPTIQGEGPHSGRPCHFIRLGGCNLSCEWCDTPYSTGQHGIPLSVVPRRTVAYLLEKVPAQTMVVITGGEPLLHAHRPAFETMLIGLHAKGCEVHVETNGTILPPPHVGAMVDHYSVSPKVDVTMVNPRHTPSLMKWSEYADKACFKFVVQGDDDPTDRLRFYMSLAEKHGCRRTHVWAMPEGATAEELAPRWRPLADACARLGINASHRLHALAWGDAKGH